MGRIGTAYRHVVVTWCVPEMHSSGLVVALFLAEYSKAGLSARSSLMVTDILAGCLIILGVVVYGAIVATGCFFGRRQRSAGGMACA